MDKRIGIDIGGVIIAQDTDEPDLFFTDSFLNAKPFPNCFSTIQKIVTHYGRENVFIISKCGPKVQAKSKEWLEHKDFFSLTGFDPRNLNFCLERYEKAGIADALNLNIFIDDRYSVLKYMLTSDKLERLILFCPPEAELESAKNNPNSKIQQVDTWNEIGIVLKL